MRRHSLVIALTISMCFAALAAKAQIKVVDSTNDNIVILAQIQDNKGVLLGFTNKDGLIPENISVKSGYSILHMAYDAHRITDQEIATGTIAMVPKVYDVNEVVVKSNSMDYVRLRGYFRKYETIDLMDTITTEFTDGIIEYVMKANSEFSMSNSGRVLAARMYKVNNYGDSILGGSYWINEKGKESKVNRMVPKMDSWLLINSERMKGLDFSLDADTIYGKYWPKAYFAKTGKIINVGTDELANKEEHSIHFPLLTLLGIDLKFYDMNENQFYHLRDSGTYKYSNLMGSSSSATGVIGGKMIRNRLKKRYPDLKKGDFPAKIKVYSEVFFTDVEYMSKQDAKKLRKEKGFDDSVEIETPDFVPELSEATKKLISTALEKQKEADEKKEQQKDK